ncbi:hypothetical protein KC19_4G091400 [Ceratodon purpureus]|uniref:Uncharacterized protein n=1 Tax=Ceratodon purpureus TaxID=3225 RepID=A0A8T0I8M3_CERPU|nr:hypothetical protein KC19_4G091400 [Ceratodon purpureus]
MQRRLRRQESRRASETEREREQCEIVTSHDSSDSAAIFTRSRPLDLVTAIAQQAGLLVSIGGLFWVVA